MLKISYILVTRPIILTAGFSLYLVRLGAGHSLLPNNHICGIIIVRSLLDRSVPTYLFFPFPLVFLNIKCFATWGFSQGPVHPQAQGRMNSSLDALKLEGSADTTQDRGLVSPPSSPLLTSSLWGFDTPLPGMRCPWNDDVHGCSRFGG